MNCSTGGRRFVLVFCALGFLYGCPNEPAPEPQLAEGIYAPMGEPRPNATPEQLATFERGKEVALKRFTPEEGLGPHFNVSFCAACHEKPAPGGGAPRYRNFLLCFDLLPDGTAVGVGVNGVQPQYQLDKIARFPTDASTDLMAGRNPIPFFGVGLLAEIPEEEILQYADEEDSDGDGISGRPNYDRGFVGRFGRKSQTVSIEGFIRGPFFNHMGITSEPLSNERKAALPVASDASNELEDETRSVGGGLATKQLPQAAAPDEPIYDTDDVDDPELSEEDLFDLVSYAMLLAAPQPDPATELTELGRSHFESAGCGGCHVPALEGPRGLIAAYTDLLLHDMGAGLADGVVMGEASGQEYRTAPLWGIVAVAPYLHDGRADTLDDAIRLHGGEAENAKDAYLAMSDEERSTLIAFLESLGGGSQLTEGLLPPDAAVPDTGEYGGPGSELSEEELDRFAEGRAVFDRNILVADGLGPFFNGDGCRACHTDPAIGGAGPIDVNVTRQGIVDFDTLAFTTPDMGTMAHKHATVADERPPIESLSNVFEVRQTPPLFGLGLIDQIPEASIVEAEDPEDADGDGIRGVAHRLNDGRLGRFGWKLDVPSLEEFTRDALSNEVGVTVPERDNQTFGNPSDDDESADPEISTSDYDDLLFFLNNLAPPPRNHTDLEQEGLGEDIFASIGCTDCHTPMLLTDAGLPVNLYSDLLLHELMDEGSTGIAAGQATMRSFRTTPLWGLSQTAPYLHNGFASTVNDAVHAHGAEGQGSRTQYLALEPEDRAALLAFLDSL
jgi:CxxC motif-containing protein (DUF1111 family)